MTSKLLSIGCYNVHRCVGTDGVRDPDRIAAVLKELDCDLIALHEVESRFEGDPRSDQLRYLEQAAGMQAVAGVTIRNPLSHYGNALLTRVPILSVREHDLSVARREPRGALEVGFEAAGNRVRLVITHLGLNLLERRRQTRTLMKVLGGEPRDVTILLGDFNEWFPRGPAVRGFEEFFGPSPAPRSFPSNLPMLALDRIWVAPRRRLVEIRRHRSQLARKSSDHLPIVASVRLG